MASSIATTTNTTTLQYPANTLIDRDDDSGYLYCMVKATTANQYDLYRSTNGGTSWASFQTLSRSNLQELGSIFIGPDSWLRWAYRTNESSQDRIYIRGMNLETGTWESELLLANPSNGGVAGAYHQGVDIWATITSNSEYYIVAVGTVSGSSGGVTLYGAYTPTIPGTTVSKDSLISGTRQWLFSGTGRQGPSIDAEHNADGKTAPTPNLWVSFGRTSAYVAKLSWTGSGWSGPTTPVTLVTSLSARDYQPGRWDGDRFCVAVPNGSTVDLYERNKANTETTKRTSGAHTQAAIRSLTLSYNAVSGDARVFAVGTSTNDLYYVDYVRLTATWSGWTIVTTDDIIGANVDNFCIRRSTHGNSKYDTATLRTTSPQVQHIQLGLSFTPSAPTWSFTGVPYVNGGAADVAASLLLDWDFHDPDTADAQTAYALSRQVGALALEYWRASDNTWQSTEQKIVTATTALTLTATQWSTDGLANGATDPAHAYKVKTWDVTDVASVYSDALVIVPSAKVNPTITAPGATVAQDSVTVTWTVSEQTAYRVTTESSGMVLQDSGWIVSVALTYTSPERLSNAVSYTVKLQTKNLEGLASDVISQAFTVAFVVPAIPTLTATPMPTLGYTSVTVTNPDRAFVSVGTAAHGNNASVTPGMPGSIVPDLDYLLLLLAAIRNSGTGTVNLPAGYTSLVSFGNVLLAGRMYVTGDVAPTVSFAGGVANADTSAQMCAFRGFVPTVHNNATQLNGSANDISTPALTITQDRTLALRIGWKQAASTGITPPGTMIEIGDMSTSTGDDQSLTWAYALQTTAGSLGANSFVVGTPAAISRGIAVSILGQPQPAYNDLYRRITGTTDTGSRVASSIAANGTAQDFRAVSGVDYSYRILVVGNNGTSTYGAWTS